MPATGDSGEPPKGCHTGLPPAAVDAAGLAGRDSVWRAPVWAMRATSPPDDSEMR
jgi:hypothetical protein